MPIPQSVLDQGNAADEALKQFGAPEDQPQIESERTDGDAAGSQASQQEEVASETSTEQRDEETPRENTVEYWKHKHATLEGRLREASSQIKEMKTAIAGYQRQALDLTTLLADMKKQLETRREASPDSRKVSTPEHEQAKPRPADYFSPDELQALRDRGYTDEDLDVLVLIGSRTAERNIEPVKQQVRQSAETGAQRAYSEFIGRLDIGFKQWASLNKDEAFLAWIDQTVVPYSGGKTFRQVIADAERALDDQTVIAVFQEYLRNSVKYAAPSAASGASDQRRGTATATIKRSMESEQAPDAGRAAESAPATPGKVWTRTEISQLHNDFARGKFRTAEDQKRYRELDYDIQLAAQQGRIRD